MNASRVPSGGEAASRRDVELVREELHELNRRIHEIDTLGTRGAGVMEQKILELTSDVAELKAEFKQAQRDRAANRKWLIGIGFTSLGVIVAMLTLLFQILQHTSGHP